MTAPAHLFGLQMFHLAAGGDSGTGILIRWRQRPVLCERMRQMFWGFPVTVATLPMLDAVAIAKR
jgi:hypothetical protein